VQQSRLPTSKLHPRSRCSVFNDWSVVKKCETFVAEFDPSCAFVEGQTISGRPAIKPVSSICLTIMEGMGPNVWINGEVRKSAT
jgi:hypothetical protein